MAIESITKTLGSGSGIDTGALVASLVEAQFANKTAALATRSAAITAQISGISKLRSVITGFDAALSALVSGGTLASKLTSSNENAVKATALAGTDLSNLSASVGVAQLASAQVSATNVAVPRDAAWRTGTLTLRLGRDTVDANGAVTGFAASGAPVSVEITAADATLDGIAAKINAAAAGVTASVITDGGGARLVLRGATGGDSAFELSASDTDGGGESLAGLAIDRNSAATTSGTRARDAIVQVDGVRYTRAGNTIDGVVPGVTLDLLGTTVSPTRLAIQKPVAALSAAVNDFVAAYNEMASQVQAEIDPASGALRADPAVTAMIRDMRALTTAMLRSDIPAEAPRTLADLGVATARDGTLSVDAKRLASALVRHPDAIESMFTPGAGLSAALSRIAKRATDDTFGLDAASVRYTGEIGRIAEAQEKLVAATEVTRTNLIRQFASMDARVAAYKSTQTFLEGQIAAWNKSND